MSLPHDGAGFNARAPDIGLTAEEFLRLIWPPSDPYEGYDGHFNVWTLKDRQSRWFKPSELAKAATTAEALAAKKDVYFATALIDLDARKQHAAIESQGTADLKKIRGTNATASALFGLWADIDIGGPIHGPAHKNTKLPPTYEDALSLIAEAIPVEPTIIIDSGHGVYPLWLFAEPWSLDNDEDREEAAELVYRFQQTIQEKAKAHGWEVDGTADLARVLRLVGTVNHKLAPVPVRVVRINANCRYQTDSFDQYLVDATYRTIIAEPVPLPETWSGSTWICSRSPLGSRRSSERAMSGTRSETPGATAAARRPSGASSTR